MVEKAAATAARPQTGAPELIEIAACKRSAHHAFINWIGNNSAEPIVHFNNVWPTPAPRLGHARVAHADLVTTDAALKGTRLDLLRAFPIRTIVNFEGKLIESINAWNDVTVSPLSEKPLRKFIFLRDPLNNTASLAQRRRRLQYIDLFRFFHQVLALERLLEAVLTDGWADDVVPLCRWQEDADFRDSLARRLRLIDAALPRDVSRFGGGSSFGDTAFEGDGRRRLYTRWRAVLSSELFLAPFTDDRFRELTRAYIAQIGGSEDVSAADFDEVVRAARDAPRAARWKRRFLDGLRANRDWIVRLERSPSLPYREYVRGRLRLLLAVR